MTSIRKVRTTLSSSAAPKKIENRLNLVIAYHKRFRRREDHTLEAGEEEEIQDDDDEEEENIEAEDDKPDWDEDEAHDHFEVEEEPKPKEPPVFKADPSVDVREVMNDVHSNFLKFLEDVQTDRQTSIKEIARLNVEVQALR